MPQLVVWVFGASGRVGAATVVRLKERAVRVIPLDRQLLNLAHSQENISERVRHLVHVHGLPDIVVHATGHVLLQGALTLGMSDYELSFRINVSAPCHINNLLIRRSPTTHHMRFVHLTSISSRLMAKNAVGYCVTKAALVAQIRQQAVEHAQLHNGRFTFFGVSPGSIAAAPRANTSRTDVSGTPADWSSNFPMMATPVARQVSMVDVIDTIEYATLIAPASMSGSNLEISGVTSV